MSPYIGGFEENIPYRPILAVPYSTEVQLDGLTSGVPCTLTGSCDKGCRTKKSTVIIIIIIIPNDHATMTYTFVDPLPHATHVETEQNSHSLLLS